MRDLESTMFDVISSITFGETRDSIAGATALVSELDRAPSPDAHGGLTFPIYSSALVVDLRVLFDASGATLQAAFPRLSRAWARAKPKFRAANGRVQRYIERRAAEGQAALAAGHLGEASADNVLDLMLIRAGQSAANHMPMDELRDELITMLLAGGDTTAIAFGWARASRSARYR